MIKIKNLGLQSLPIAGEMVSFFVLLFLQILAARHLEKTGRSIASPFIEVEIIGIERDNAQKYKTQTIGKENNLFVFCKKFN